MEQLVPECDGMVSPPSIVCVNDKQRVMKELVARLDVRLGGNYVATEQFGGTHTHTAICSCPLLLTHTPTQMLASHYALL